MGISTFALVADRYVIPCKAYLPEEEPTVVVVGVHGFSGDKESSVLATLGAALREKKGALVCFDFPAHGESTAKDHCLRVENCKADLMAVLQEVQNRFPHASYGIFATSFGGYIALLCSEALKGCKVVLRAPAVTMAETFANIIPLSLEDFSREGEVVCGFERKMVVPWDFYEDLLRNPPGIPNYPLLIIHGTEDDLIPYEAVASLCENHPNITLVTIEGADHRFKKPGELEKIVNTALPFYIPPLDHSRFQNSPCL